MLRIVVEVVMRGLESVTLSRGGKIVFLIRTLG